MKSIYFTPEHDAFRRAVRRFIEREVAPHADAWEALGHIPRSVFAAMGELGFLGILYPEEHGGANADIFYALAFLEELPRSQMGGFCAAVSVQQFMAPRHIAEHGSEELKRRYLAPSVAGRMTGALAITEPDAGSDVAAIAARAERAGDFYVVNGSKMFITNGAEADFYTLAVRTRQAPGPGYISLLAVDAGSPGITVSRRLAKLGWHSSDTAGLTFENVRVPASHLIGQENAGFYYLMEAFQLERLAAAAIAVGSAQVCLDLTVDYMGSRRVFGKPLSRYQALTHRLADLSADLESARQLTYHAAWLLGQGDAAVRECTMAKLAATELGARMADACLQCFGGYGFMEEYPVARFHRDARAATIAAGTSEIMREILARLMFTPGERAAPEPAASPPRPELPASGGLEGAAAAAQQTDDAREPTPATESARGELDVETLMLGLPHRFRPDRAEGWQARFHYQLAGAPAPLWTIDIAGGRCRVEQGLHGEPDCSVVMDAAVFIGIQTGAVNPQTAFMAGQVQVSDLPQMLKFLKVFRAGNAGGNG